MGKVRSKGKAKGGKRRKAPARAGVGSGAVTTSGVGAPGAGAPGVGTVNVAELPRVDALQDVPSFFDMTSDEAQRAAFEEFRAELAASDASGAELLQLGCVVRLDRGFPLVATETETLRAEHSVAFAKPRGDEERMLPAVGDWVAVRVDPGHDMGVIECVLPRRTVFERWRGKNRGEHQVLAANVDTVFIVQPLGAARDTIELMRDRIARCLVLVNDCGAQPVVVFTKADRCSEDELAAAVAQARVLAGAPARVVVTSSKEQRGLDEVRACVPAGSCAMILGESGAGKSTLLNTLLGHEALATNDVRERDDAGRHTTVARVMVTLPDPCGVIVDAPGLRSLPLVGHERGLARTFPDVVEASRGCRFNDCTHTHEPGCSVLEAVETGEIKRVRLDAFLSLSREMRVSAQSLDPDIHLT